MKKLYERRMIGFYLIMIFMAYCVHIIPSEKVDAIVVTFAGYLLPLYAMLVGGNVFDNHIKAKAGSSDVGQS